MWNFLVWILMETTLMNNINLETILDKHLFTANFDLFGDDKKVIIDAMAEAVKNHTQGMYDEVKVKELIEDAVNELNADQRGYIDITDWFEQNKNK